VAAEYSVAISAGVQIWLFGHVCARPHNLSQPTIRFLGSYGGAVDGYRMQVLLVDLGGVLFSFDHEHRLNVLGECLGLSPGRVDELLWQSGFSADCDAGAIATRQPSARRSAASLATSAVTIILIPPGAARSARTRR
jgi:hypothetical protein